jgi:phosphoribosylamine-glycine ligase
VNFLFFLGSKFLVLTASYDHRTLMEQDPGGSSGGFESYTSKAGMKEVDLKERKGGDFTNYKRRAGCCCE